MFVYSSDKGWGEESPHVIDISNLWKFVVLCPDGNCQCPHLCEVSLYSLTSLEYLHQQSQGAIMKWSLTPGHFTNVFITWPSLLLHKRYKVLPWMCVGSVNSCFIPHCASIDRKSWSTFLCVDVGLTVGTDQLLLDIFMSPTSSSMWSSGNLLVSLFQDLC